MRYIITGKYSSGSDYADYADSLTDLERLIYDLGSQETWGDRVLVDTIKIETEDDRALEE